MEKERDSRHRQLAIGFENSERLFPIIITLEDLV